MEDHAIVYCVVLLINYACEWVRFLLNNSRSARNILTYVTIWWMFLRVEWIRSNDIVCAFRKCSYRLCQWRCFPIFFPVHISVVAADMFNLLYLIACHFPQTLKRDKKIYVEHETKRKRIFYSVPRFPNWQHVIPFKTISQSYLSEEQIIFFGIIYCVCASCVYALLLFQQNFHMNEQINYWAEMKM